jgi:predicted phosphoadenosine phosphosulfate sulfurtransferase
MAKARVAMRVWRRIASECLRRDECCLPVSIRKTKQEQRFLNFLDLDKITRTTKN